MAQTVSVLAVTLMGGGLLLVGGLIGLTMVLGRSSYVTRAQEFIDQPVQFSHKHHVADDGIDCRYCHTSVEVASTERLNWPRPSPLSLAMQSASRFPVDAPWTMKPQRVLPHATSPT